MVKNKQGQSVPFFAADGKGKMRAGGRTMKTSKYRAGGGIKGTKYKRRGGKV